jgi:hypothetical protein
VNFDRYCIPSDSIGQIEECRERLYHRRKRRYSEIVEDSDYANFVCAGFEDRLIAEQYRFALRWRYSAASLTWSLLRHNREMVVALNPLVKEEIPFSNAKLGQYQKSNSKVDACPSVSSGPRMRTN